jgi:SAM-dependent methyltransferase
MKLPINRAREALRRHGVSQCVKLIFLYVYRSICDRFPRRRRYLKEYLQEQLDFDGELNIHTWKTVTLKDLRIDSPNLSLGTDYDPSPVRFIAKFLAQLSIDFSKFVFIDLGSGLGRSVFVAGSLAPFRRLIGIEFSPELHRAALDNLAACRRDRLKCEDVEFLCCDAAEFSFPPDPLVLHLFNPFGPQVLRKVVDRLVASVIENDREV